MTPSRSTSEWSWSRDELQRVGYRTVDIIVEHLTNLHEQPVFRPFPRDRAAAYLQSDPPEDGVSADVILDRFQREIAPYPFGNGHPRSTDG